MWFSDTLLCSSDTLSPARCNINQWRIGRRRLFFSKRVAHKQALRARLCHRKQVFRLQMWTSGSLTPFPAPLHRLLFLNSAGVKEREVMNPSSQLDAVSKVRAWLLRQWAEVGAWPTLRGKWTFSACDCRALLLCYLGLASQWRWKQRPKWRRPTDPLHTAQLVCVCVFTNPPLNNDLFLFLKIKETQRERKLLWPI